MFLACYKVYADFSLLIRIYDKFLIIINGDSTTHQSDLCTLGKNMICKYFG